jgi:hypothetical protein
MVFPESQVFFTSPTRPIVEPFAVGGPNRPLAHFDAQSLVPPSRPVPISICEHVPLVEKRKDNTPSPQTEKLDDFKSGRDTSPAKKDMLGNTIPVVSVMDMLKACLKEVGVEQSKSNYVMESIKVGLDRAVDKVIVQKQGIAAKAPQAADKGAKRKIKQGKTSGMTMMICNIPCRARQEDLLQAVESLGFGGTFESLTLACRFGQSDSNLGYAFVHFSQQEDADRFAAAFEGYRFSRSGSTKTCTVKVASSQDGCNLSKQRGCQSNAAVKSHNIALPCMFPQAS